ncbi:MAG: type II secretion system protein [Neisseriaceae bacterium]|nr:MAG: type II secretion system protein [Neisseriaceae bacterium]
MPYLRLHTARGFTLIELLVVIAIIGILSSVVLSALNTARARGRDAQRLADIHEVRKAIELYYSANGSYPSTGSLNTVYMDPGCIRTPTAPDQITSDWVPGVTPTYIKQLPRDPEPKDRARGTANSAACYMYASNGQGYILSAWATVETGPNTTRMYSRAGFRETSLSDQYYICNHPNIGNSSNGDYYQYSFTVTGGNLVCTW